MASSIYDISLNMIGREEISLGEFRNKKLLIVNVASQCGFTKQYTQLQELYEMYRERLSIIGCPCNDFGYQEPDSNEEIINFCQLNYGVKFPISEKIGIKKDTHELYEWLTQVDKNGSGNYSVQWNFHKFLINEDGQIFKSLTSDVEPLSEVILDWLQK